MYHIFQFSFRKLIECMFIHSAKMIPYYPVQVGIEQPPVVILQLVTDNIQRLVVQVIRNTADSAKPVGMVDLKFIN